MFQYDTVSYCRSADRSPVTSASPAPATIGAEPELVTDPGRQRQILIAMCTALIAVVASVSALNVAQQTLAIELGASQGELLWIINGYTLALAALLMPIGAIGDRFGRKPILLAGLVLFVGANAMAGFAGSVGVLLVARVLAGAAAAMIMPVTLSVITTSFPPEQRARAVGIWSGFAGAGGILGLFASAIVIDKFTWPWLFAMPVVFAGLALAFTVRSVGNSREHSTGRFDTIGSLLSAIAIGGIVLGIHEGPEKGWTHSLTLAGLVAGGLALVAFVAWETRLTHPLLDIRLFRHRGLAAGTLTLILLFVVLVGIFLLLTQFTQAVLGFSAIGSAAALLPMMALIMPLAAFSPTLATRIGTRTVMLVGIGFFTTGLALLAGTVSADGSYLHILPGLLVVSVGIGMCMTPATMMITESLPAESQGVASALNDTVRELGGAIGVALLGSVVSAGYRSSVSGATTDLSPELAHRVEEGIGSAYAASPDLGASAPSIIHSAKEAFVDGWRLSMWVGVALAVAAFVYLAVWGPRRGAGMVEVEHEAAPASDALPVALSVD
jgi:EmrB/QacA subfamily drug resistance transporter